jgi:hypothetical protein
MTIAMGASVDNYVHDNDSDGNYEGVQLNQAELATAKLNEYINLKEMNKKQERAELAALVSSRLVQIENREKDIQRVSMKLKPAVSSLSPEDKAIKNAERDKEAVLKKIQENRSFRVQMGKEATARNKLDEASTAAAIELKAKMKRDRQVFLRLSFTSF